MVWRSIEGKWNKEQFLYVYTVLAWRTQFDAFHRIYTTASRIVFGGVSKAMKSPSLTSMEIISGYLTCFIRPRFDVTVKQ